MLIELKARVTEIYISCDPKISIMVMVITWSNFGIRLLIINWSISLIITIHAVLIIDPKNYNHCIHNFPSNTTCLLYHYVFLFLNHLYWTETCISLAFSVFIFLQWIIRVWTFNQTQFTLHIIITHIHHCDT